VGYGSGMLYSVRLCFTVGVNSWVKLTQAKTII
jgi:hypothetical protein